jgi:hypothetical protein
LLGDEENLRKDPWQERGSMRLQMSLFQSLIPLSWKSLEQVMGVPALETVCKHMKVQSLEKVELSLLLKKH